MLLATVPSARDIWCNPERFCKYLRRQLPGFEDSQIRSETPSNATSAPSTGSSTTASATSASGAPSSSHVDDLTPAIATTTISKAGGNAAFARGE